VKRAAYPVRLTAPWPALVEAINALPTGHPTRRAVVGILAELAPVPSPVRETIAQHAIVAVMLGPPLRRDGPRLLA
jgi:hypothetical protein